MHFDHFPCKLRINLGKVANCWQGYWIHLFQCHKNKAQSICHVGAFAKIWESIPFTRRDPYNLLKQSGDESKRTRAMKKYHMSESTLGFDTGSEMCFFFVQYIILEIWSILIFLEGGTYWWMRTFWLNIGPLFSAECQQQACAHSRQWIICLIENVLISGRSTRFYAYFTDQNRMCAPNDTASQKNYR